MKFTGSRVRLPGLNSWICHLLTIVILGGFLNLSKSAFLIRKMGIIKYLPSVYYDDQIT